ncbi:MAG: hypothetical protein Q8L52_00310 [bacterium]|nr:hypothetical protein [bacterium]
MPRTFAQLEQDGCVSAAEVGEVLDDYVRTGAAISGRVVIKLIDQARPCIADRQLMKTIALKGAVNQTRRGCTNDATAYLQVAAHL